MALFKFVAIVAALFFSVAQSQYISPKHQAKCHTGGPHMIAVRGHGTPAGYGGLNLTVNAIARKIANTTRYPLPYYTYPSPTGYSFQAEVANCTALFIQALTNYTTSCPTTPIILLGYSEGGVCVMNGLCGASSSGFATTASLNSSIAKNVIATVIFGDETNVSGQPYDVGTCASHGIFPRSNPAGCSAFAPNMQSYCDASDPLCCNGTNNTVHHLYPQIFDTQVTAFVVAQWNKYNHTVVNGTG